MPSEFIGSLVSIDCGQLGAYQGRVEKIDPVMNTLTISHAFHNGLCCEQNEISLSSTAILDIKIIHASQEAQEIISRKATPSKMTKEIDEATRPTCVLPVKIIKATSKVQPASSTSGVSHLDLAYNTNGSGRRCSPASSPKFLELGSDLSCRRSRISKSANRESSTVGVIDEDVGQGRGEKCKNSAGHHRGRKTLAKKKNDKNIDCFRAPAEPFKQDFDFESNLALFDKKAVFQEIEHGVHDLCLELDPRERKFRHDENILQATENNSINVLKEQYTENPSNEYQLYFTDTGLAVPSLSVEMRQKICEVAAQSGLTDSRVLEAYGRGASEMAIHLIGGSHRIHPKNGHQVPAVVVMCGLHEAGALGACCARVLSTHGVQVTVLIEQSVNIPGVLSQEIELYRLTGNKLIHNVSELPGTIDLLVTALDSPTSPAYSRQSWYQNVIAHVKNSDIKAQILALDPPLAGPGLAARRSRRCLQWTLSILACSTACISCNRQEEIDRWSLCKVAPLQHMASSCGSLYLCDLSIPSAIFNKCGVTYISPFGSKFVIPLYGQE